MSEAESRSKRAIAARPVALPPACPHRPPCPGCPRYGERGLARGAREALEALAREHGVAHVDYPPGGARAGFRLRARLAIRGRLGAPKLGLFELGTHKLVHVPHCAVHHPLVNRVADATLPLEALIAAIYLDGGLEPCRAFVEKFVFTPDPETGTVLAPAPLDAKSELQELAQALRMPIPRYVIVHEKGPEHAKMFTVEARVGTEYTARAEGASKKIASQRAAALLLETLRAQPAPGA